MTRVVLYAGVLAALLTAGVLLARRFDTLAPGLTGSYSTSAAGAAAVSRRETIDRPPFGTAVASHWSDGVPGAFSVTWAGQIWVPKTGRYTLAVNADTGTSLFVDGRTLFDNVQHPEDQYAASTQDLAGGGHAIFLSYTHRGGDSRLALLWGEDGGALTEIPETALQSRRAGAAQVRLTQLLAVLPEVLGWMWAAVLMGIEAILLIAVAARGRLALERAGLWREMRWVLAASTALNVVGVWWGLPAGWVPIELTPTFTFDFIAHHFAHGWYDAYPPLQYYFLSAAITPLLVLQRVSGVVIDGVGGHSLMVLIFRSLSLLAAAGTVVCAALTTADAFGRRAGLFAAAVFALTAPFVFYAKTANVDVPYMFWFAVSMVFYVRMVRDLRMRDFILFAAAAACAVCTKDQAYGLYVLVPLVVIVCLWSERRREGRANALPGVLLDPRVIAAAAVAATCFAVFHNLLFNFEGFRRHVAFITGPGSQDYRVYEPSVAGRLALLVRTVRLVGVSMGWPMFVLAVLGAVVAARRPTRTMAICLLLPVISYYVFFINVVLYNYDRFVIPICFVLAGFAGLALDRALPSKRIHPVAAVASALFAYTLIYACTVDYLMVTDSRYSATRWMREHVGQSLVAGTEPPETLPGLDGFRSISVETVEELQREQPRFFVLNVDYARAAKPGSDWATLVEGLEQQRLGYRTVARFRNAVPWSWLPLGHPDLVGPREDTVVFSVLRDINPTIEIYERGADSPAPR